MKGRRIATHLLLHIDIGDSFGAPHEAVPHNRLTGAVGDRNSNTATDFPEVVAHLTSGLVVRDDALIRCFSLCPCLGADLNLMEGDIVAENAPHRLVGFSNRYTDTSQ